MKQSTLSFQFAICFYRSLEFVCLQHIEFVNINLSVGYHVNNIEIQNYISVIDPKLLKMLKILKLKHRSSGLKSNA